MLNAGYLRHLISFERDQTTEVFGAETRTPIVYSRAWAKPEPLTARERFAGQSVNSEADWRFTVQYRTDVRTTDRVIYRGVHYEILGLEPDEIDQTQLAITCKSSGSGFVPPPAA